MNRGEVPLQESILYQRFRSKEVPYIPETGAAKIVLTCNAGENRGPEAVRFLNEADFGSAVCLLGGYNSLRNLVQFNDTRDNKLFIEKVGCGKKDYYEMVLPGAGKIVFLLSKAEKTHYQQNGALEQVNKFLQQYNRTTPIYQLKDDDEVVDQKFLLDLLRN